MDTMTYVPSTVQRRLACYLGYAKFVAGTGADKIVTSSELGDELGFHPSQVRRDLLYVGALAGKRGTGFRADSLVVGLTEALRDRTDEIEEHAAEARIHVRYLEAAYSVLRAAA